MEDAKITRKRCYAVLLTCVAAAVTLAVELSRGGSGTPAHDDAATAHGGLAYASNGRRVDDLRMKIASWSIGMLQNDTSSYMMDSLSPKTAMVNMTSFAGLVDEALDAVGVRGVFLELFDNEKFARALTSSAEKDWGLTNERLRVGIGPGHANCITVLYWAVPNERWPHNNKTIPHRCIQLAGCLFWLRHYSGTIASAKLFREGFLRLGTRPENNDEGKEDYLSGDDARLDNATSVVRELQSLIMLGIRQTTPSDAEHGFIWHHISTVPSVREEIALNGEYPVQLAADFCGDSIGDGSNDWGTRINTSGLNPSFVCYHGIGHGVYYAHAWHELHELYITSAGGGIGDVLVELKESRCQLAPMSGFRLSDEMVCHAWKVCGSAPTKPMINACYNGLVHSYGLISGIFSQSFGTLDNMGEHIGVVRSMCQNK